MSDRPSRQRPASRGRQPAGSVLREDRVQDGRRPQDSPSPLTPLPRERGTRFRAGILACGFAALAAGCFQASSGPERPNAPDDLARRVAVALDGNKDAALLYAGLYAALAERFERRADATTGEAADIAGRAADALAAPGLLKQVVKDELNPVIGKPQPVTPELAAMAAAKLRALSDACREAAR